MIIKPREIALKVLENQRRNGTAADEALSGLISKPGIDKRDAALATALVYGVLQNANLLDFYIGAYCNGKLEPKVRDILRLSAYQIIFMTRIPASAAVNEGVRMCGEMGYGRASGLVNAVLRRLADNRDALPEVPEPGTAASLAITYSHPLWLVEEFIETLGFDGAEKLLKANNAPIPVTAQVNTLKTTSDELARLLKTRGVEARRHPWLSDCLTLDGMGSPAALPEFGAGLFYIQDAAARLAVTASGVKPGDTVLDLCAAPGGKSFTAVIAMGNCGRIIAADVNERKLRHINDGTLRLGLSIIETRAMDARSPDSDLTGIADVVIADAPCSGLGVIRKKPDIRYKAPETLDGLPALQGDILDGAAGCVKPGGVLLYSTCTVRRRENEDVVSGFLERNREFALERFTLPEPVGTTESVTLWPHIHSTDGFFICKLRRKGGAAN